jgi:rfaE bifunctional protein kinase chain/domain
MSTSSEQAAPEELHPDSIAALASLARIEPKPERCVFVSGNFNILHPGHLRLLKHAAECGDSLVVGVNANGYEGAFIDEELRLEGVRATSFVNHAFILRDPPERFIARLRPAIVVKGAEHEQMENREVAALRSYGGRLLFSSGEVRFASLDLLRREFNDLDLEDISKPVDYLARHSLTSSDIHDILGRIHNLRVVVVGDLIVDDYITCDALGMSQEDPTLVVTPVASDRFVGGAGIVAAHARSLGAKVTFFTVTGNDEVASYARNKLAEYDVPTHALIDETRPTTLKQRFRAADKTLLRVNHLRQTPISKELQTAMLESVMAGLPDTDLLIFSDFNYGCLPQPLVDTLIERCREQGIMLVADSQSSSQTGDVSRFHHMTLITPTEREARLAMRNFTDGLIVLSESLRRKCQAEHLLVTLGTEGLLIHTRQPDETECSYADDRLPALNKSARDVSGAGDSLLTATSLALAAGADIWLASYLGALAAACQVGRLGNSPLKPTEIELEARR